jgi:hypothetical protein
MLEDISHSNTGKVKLNDKLDLAALYEDLSKILLELGPKDMAKEGIISKASIWRWGREVNTEAPTCDLVLKVLRRHSGLRHIHAIAKHYGSNIEQFLDVSFPAMLSETDNRVIDKNTDVLEDEFDFQIYFMCCNERGASLEEIIYTIGTIAAKKANIPEDKLTNDLILASGKIAELKVERLIEKKVILMTDNLLKCDETFTYIQGDNGLQQSIKLLSNNIKPKGWQSGENVFYLTSESVERDVAKEVSQLLREAYSKASDILTKNRSDSKQAFPFVISVAGESLVFKQSIGDKELQ